MHESNKFTENISNLWSDDSIRLITVPSKTAKSIYFYAQEVGYFKTIPGYFTERKNLNSFLIIYTISGAGFLRYEDSEYILTEGQYFFINCMNYHYYENYKNNNWEFLWIHFNGFNALGYYNEFRKNNFRIYNASNTDFFQNSIKQIININTNKTVSTEIQTSNIIVNILSEVLIQNSTNEGTLLYIPKYIASLMKYIDLNFNSELQLDDLSKQFGVSKFYLSKEFRKFTGTTIGEYIINSRISYSKELLKYSDLSVSEIACKSGINNVSHFINLFKSRENMTPLAYRKEWKI